MRREWEWRSLLWLIYSINHSIWFLFIFRSRTVISAAHWALYALPRRFPSTTKTVLHALGYNLERRRAPALLRYFTLPNLYGEIPSDLSLVKPTVCRHAGIWASRTPDLCQRCGLVLNDCKHTPVWNYVLLSSRIWQSVQRAKCAAPPCIHFLSGRCIGVLLLWFSLLIKPSRLAKYSTFDFLFYPWSF